MTAMEKRAQVSVMGPPESERKNWTYSNWDLLVKEAVSGSVSDRGWIVAKSLRLTKDDNLVGSS